MTTVEGPEFDKLETEIRTELDRLEASVSALALDALSDLSVRDELEALEAEVAEGKVELQRLLAARMEQGKRDAEARAEVAAAARAEALRHAQKLQGEREQAALEVDEHLQGAAQALKHWDTITSQQTRAFHAAGRNDLVRAAQARSWQPECAILFAVREAKLPHGIVGIMPPSVAQVRPLVENDFRGVPKLEEGEDA